MKKFAAALVALVAIASLVAIGARFPRRPAPASRLSEEVAPASPRPIDFPEAEESARIEARTSPEASGIREFPPPPEGSPAFRIVCLETGKPLDEAWVVFRREVCDEGGEAGRPGEADDGYLPKPGGFSGIRFRAQGGGIIRVALETLDGEKAGGRFFPWEEAAVGAPGYPEPVVQIDAFLAFLSPALSRSPSAEGRPADASLPVLGLHPGAEWKGRVVDGQGRPIAGAWAFGEGDWAVLPLPRTGRLLKELSVRSEYATRTDAEGYFRVRALANLEELARLEALGPEGGESSPWVSGTFRAEGFLPTRVTLAFFEPNVVTLYRAVAIEGAVTDLAGAPLEGASVRAVALGEAEPSGAISPAVLELAPHIELTTGPEGVFRALLSDELVYDVQAEAYGYFAQFLGQYRPRAGEKLLFPLRPWSKATARLLSGERKEPVASSPVRMLFPLGRKRSEESTDAGGRLSFACPPEAMGREILFVASAAGYARLVREEISAEAFDLGDVFLQPGHSLDVLVVDGSGEVLPGIELEIELIQAADADFTSLREWGAEEVGLISARGTTDEEGRWTYEHLLAGVYRIEVVRSSDGQGSDRVGGRTWEIFEPRGRVIDVPETRRVTVRLFELGWIKGTVVTLSGEGVGSASVELVRGEGRSGYSWTDGCGRFRLDVLGAEESASGQGPALRAYLSRSSWLRPAARPPYGVALAQRYSVPYRFARAPCLAAVRSASGRRSTY